MLSFIKKSYERAKMALNISSIGCWTLQMRYVVTILGMVGCTVDYLVRYGLSVAIVSIVGEKDEGHPPYGVCPGAINGTSTTNTDDDAVFDWSLQQQGIILGTFFWGYFITKSTGGRISELLGPREVMAASLCFSGILCMLCPFAAYLHPIALAVLRFFMGIMQGPAFPALYCVLAKWAPSEQLATMVTVAYSGMSVGSLIALGGSGWVVHVMGWQWVFYLGGILALVWTPLWLWLVTNQPDQNPYISKDELDLLAANEDIKPRRTVPWRKLLTCWRFYPSIVAEVASSWVSNLTMTQGPTFLAVKVGLNMKKVSYVLAVMQSSAWVGAFTFGRISDKLIQYHCLSKLNTRRLIHSAGTVLLVAGILGMVIAGCDSWAISVFIVVVAVGSASTLSTFTLTPMDIAPNYSGTLSGLLGIGNISGFVAPIVTNNLLVQTKSWDSSLLLAGGLYLGSSILYVTTTTATVQDWNYYEDLPSSDEMV